MKQVTLTWPGLACPQPPPSRLSPASLSLQASRDFPRRPPGWGPCFLLPPSLPPGWAGKRRRRDNGTGAAPYLAGATYLVFGGGQRKSLGFGKAAGIWGASVDNAEEGLSRPLLAPRGLLGNRGAPCKKAGGRPQEQDTSRGDVKAPPPWLERCPEVPGRRNQE